ncbi:MAG: hypothetical protein DMG81_01275 [Acidobacteria bacterium]|nr:MAG: hypothetical protein DMG81_01275 [Acidobacteriota bacterium]
MNADGDITDLFTTPMEAGPQNGLGNYRFESEIQPGLHSGLYGYAIRVVPKHRDLVNPFLPGLILWACGASSTRPASGAQEAYSAGAS